MTKINDTTAFPVTQPAQNDYVIGTDVSNTTNSAGGETVNFDIGEFGVGGLGQTWQSVSRSNNTSYQNTTGAPIMVSGEVGWQNSNGFQVSADNSNWVTLMDASENDFTNPFSVIVPNGIYYRIQGINFVAELR